MLAIELLLLVIVFILSPTAGWAIVGIWVAIWILIGIAHLFCWVRDAF